VNTGTKTITGAKESARFFRYNDRLDNNERSMVKGLREVRSISAKLELPSSMREQAAHWYRNVVQNELLQGRSIEGFAAACVYVAARERSYPITIDGLAECCPVSAQEIRHQMSILHKEFSVEMKPAKPGDFLASIISELPVERTFEYKVRKLLESVTEDGYHIGKHPAAIAATAIYTLATATDIGLNQNTVAETAGVSTVTISRHNQEIKQFLKD
jgi:transcription initiation factor TFIIB